MDDPAKLPGLDDAPQRTSDVRRLIERVLSVVVEVRLRHGIPPSCLDTVGDITVTAQQVPFFVGQDSEVAFLTKADPVAASSHFRVPVE